MRVALALGAGGARGYAHIGMIEALAQRGFEIVGVSGSSMGAVVGGLYAAGRLDDYAQWVRTIGQRDLLRMLDPTLTAPGAFRGDKALVRVSELLDGARIESLPVPFTAVATDLLARREVWFRRRPVDIAIRASVGVPAVITPVVVDGRLLADGGLTNPLPIAPTMSTPADAIIAVSLSGRPTTTQLDVAQTRDPCGTHHSDERWDRVGVRPSSLLEYRTIRRVIARRTNDGDLASAQAAGDAFGDLPPGLGKIDIMTLAIEAMHAAVARYQLASYPPDLLIEVPIDSCRSYEFHRAGEMIDLGHRVTAEALNRAPAPG